MTSSEFPALFQKVKRDTSGSKPFVVGAEALTYGKFFERQEKLATLFDQWGLGIGDRVVLASDDDLAVITIFLALLRAGITTVILNPGTTRDEAQILAKTADPSGVILDKDIRTRLALDTVLPEGVMFLGIEAESGNRTGGLRKWVTGRGSPQTGRDSYPGILDSLDPLVDQPEQIPDSTTAMILFTSGTTSRPKGVELTHRNLWAQEQTFIKQYGLDQDTRLLNILPLFHTDGITHGPLLAISASATAYRPFRFRVDALPDLLDCIYRYRITNFITVPAIMHLILQMDGDLDDTFDTPDFRFLISTAAFLDEKTWQAFEDRFEVRVVNVYGLTETVCEALYCGPDEATRRLGTIGKPVDCQARICDDSGNEVPPGEVGELALKGNNVMKGYFRQPDETAEVLSDGWFKTGDLATVDPGGFYRIVGRKKNVIITAGVNVYPEDVTEALRSMPGVFDAVTFGVEDESWGERVVSCVVPHPGRDISIEEVAAFCLDKLSREKLPSKIHVLETLPRGPAGKVVIGQVKEMVDTLEREAAPALGVGAGDLETRIRMIAARVFKADLAKIELASNPDSVKGWNSLAHVDFLLALEKEFGIRLSPRDFMKIATVGDAVSTMGEKHGAYSDSLQEVSL